MATVLSIESSTPNASIALMRDGVPVYEGGCVSDRHHNALLFQPLDEAVEALGEHRLDLVLIGTGPGSYSGTRVGIAAGQGVALVHGCPAVGLSSLLAVDDPSGVAVGDARRGSAWKAELSAGELPQPELLEMDALADALAGADRVFSFEPADRFDLAAVDQVVPSAKLLAEAWERLSEDARERLLSEPPQPAYLKPPHITESKKGHPLLRRQ